MLELAVIKRKAKYAWEIGVFGVDETADTELKHLPADEVAWAEITTPRNLALLRYIWAIAQKLADGGLYDDKDEAMDDLKIRARFIKIRFDRGRAVIVPRSLARQSHDVLSRLRDRFVFVICRDLLPHMTESKFRKEVEDMVS